MIRDAAPGLRAAYLEPGLAGLLPTVQSTAPQVNPGGRPAPRGITVEGEVKNYVPVTDAMLRNPDPSDWLMIRHDYKATYHSPLNQITAQNVNDLRLMWSWAMQDRASNGNQPAAAPEMAQRCTPTPLWR